MSDPVPALGELIGVRLGQMVRAGWLTPDQYGLAVCSGHGAMAVVRRYLEHCWMTPSALRRLPKGT